jgi:hypothetical protein
MTTAKWTINTGEQQNVVQDKILSLHHVCVQKHTNEPFSSRNAVFHLCPKKSAHTHTLTPTSAKIVGMLRSN